MDGRPKEYERECSIALRDELPAREQAGWRQGDEPESRPAATDRVTVG